MTAMLDGLDTRIQALVVLTLAVAMIALILFPFVLIFKSLRNPSVTPVKSFSPASAGKDFAKTCGLVFAALIVISVGSIIFFGGPRDAQNSEKIKEYVEWFLTGLLALFCAWVVIKTILRFRNRQLPTRGQLRAYWSNPRNIALVVFGVAALIAAYRILVEVIKAVVPPQ